MHGLKYKMALKSLINEHAKIYIYSKRRLQHLF